jgi:succinate dehydrogenase / fumarate reductase membrane anchor subunit
VTNDKIKYWALNAVSALVLVVLLGIHMGLMHLPGLLGQINPAWSDPLAWAQVSERGRSAVTTGGYVLLLGVALFHGLYGVHTMLTEFFGGERAERRIAAGCWIAGIALFVIGAISSVVFHISVPHA